MNVKNNKWRRESKQKIEKAFIEFLQNKDIKPIITHQYWLSQFKCLILATN